MKSLPSNPTESVRKLNPHLWPLNDEPAPEPGQGPCHITKRIRQSNKPLMNKLEQEWFSYLCCQYPHLQFYPQTARFKLGNGIWYKPDILCLDFGFEHKFACWEVKGPHAFRGGFENLKVAAHKYPEIKWVLVWKENDQWREQVVLP